MADSSDITRGRWLTWLGVYLIVAVITTLGTYFLATRGNVEASVVLVIGSGALCLWWLFTGFGAYYETPWLRRVAIVLMALEIWATIGFLLLTAGKFGLLIGWTGTILMAAIFVVGLAVIRFILSPGAGVLGGILGVARTFVDEAIRMKIALVFIVGVLLVVPMLPFFLADNERLNYRMEFFLVWSLGLVSTMLSIMTVFLACGTITRDLSRKHVYMTLTKPIGRFQYLIGKWLGIAVLNVLLLSVSGVGIYAFAKYLQTQNAQDPQDAFVVHYGILTARESVTPVPTAGYGLKERVDERIETLKRQQPLEYGGRTTSSELNAVQQELLRRWYTLAPRGSETYVFKGLDPARNVNYPLQLRFKPKSLKRPQDEKVRLAFWLNGRAYPTDAQGRHRNPGQIVDDTHHVFELTPDLIDEDGYLTVRIQNVDLIDANRTFDSSVSFEELEVLYRVGSFGPNLAKGLAITWLRLSFLATLGLAAGTFLGFPVACVMSMLFFFVAIGSGYVTESQENFAGLGPATLTIWERLWWIPATFFSRISEGEIWSALKIPIRLVGQGFVSITPAFSNYNPTPLISSGRLVPTDMLLGAVWRIGLIWTGLVGLIGWLIFRKRELARVIV